ncbi:MAG: PleD family two-component system response regulator, partial [Planctomycetia bacterium]
MAVRVLIVEDDSGSALVLKSRLESSGYEVVLADSGTKAITVVRELAFGALLISDQLKRGLDAMECLRRARSTPELAVTPIIFYHQRAALPTHRAKAFDA